MKKLKVFFSVIVVLLIICFAVLMYFFRTTKNIDVSWNEEDYNSCITKSGVTIENMDSLNLIELINGDFTSTGSNNINNSFTNEEISAMLSKTNNTIGPIEDIKVKFLGNNEAEASFKFKENVYRYFESNESLNAKINSYGNLKNIVIGTPVYIKVKLDSAKDKQISGNIQNVYLGNIQMPEDIVKESETVLVDMLNTIISNYNGFNIEEMNFESDKLNFKGQLPEVVKGK
ncbi:MAG: hypothetical protein PHD15_05955 [Clostridia bacterium]|nr:hypothetical protein [Clostridia bacterium]MDD4387275.1 hypothetical protein [Clostridia bacterium]